MITSRRILFHILIIALIVALIPLWGKSDMLPCLFMRSYAISYGSPEMRIIHLDGAFHGFPPLCEEILRLSGHSF